MTSTHVLPLALAASLACSCAYPEFRFGFGGVGNAGGGGSGGVPLPNPEPPCGQNGGLCPGASICCYSFLDAVCDSCKNNLAECEALNTCDGAPTDAADWFPILCDTNSDCPGGECCLQGNSIACVPGSCVTHACGQGEGCAVGFACDHPLTLGSGDPTPGYESYRFCLLL